MVLHRHYSANESRWAIIREVKKQNIPGRFRLVLAEKGLYDVHHHSDDIAALLKLAANHCRSL